MHNQIAQAILAVDSDIEIVGVGGPGSQGSVPGQGDWSEVILIESADYMDLINEHLYAMPTGGLIDYTQSLAMMVDTFVAAPRYPLYQIGHIPDLGH